MQGLDAHIEVGVSILIVFVFHIGFILSSVTCTFINLKTLTNVWMTAVVFEEKLVGLE